MTLSEKYLDYIGSVRRYSARTRQIYADVLDGYGRFAAVTDDSMWPSALTPQLLRGYEVELMDVEGDGASTVSLHLSVLSGFCKFLVREGVLEANPVRLVPRPRESKRLPVVYREEALRKYMDETAWVTEEDFGTDPGMYVRRLDRLIVSMLYQTGMRRAEIIALDRSSLDLSRRTLRVLGKGDKVRVLPLTELLCDELRRYLDCAQAMGLSDGSADAPLLVTIKGRRLYPVYVDRVIKKELGGVSEITVRRSPHVLRHSLATELLDEGADLNAIKEMLGHSSLAATQVYTHNSVEKLRKVYSSAHPRAQKSPED